MMWPSGGGFGEPLRPGGVVERVVISPPPLSVHRGRGDVIHVTTPVVVPALPPPMHRLPPGHGRLPTGADGASSPVVDAIADMTERVVATLHQTRGHPADHHPPSPPARPADAYRDDDAAARRLLQEQLADHQRLLHSRIEQQDVVLQGMHTALTLQNELRKSRRREHDTDGESDVSGRPPSHRGQKSPRGKEPQVLELRAELENVRASVCDLAREASEERTHHRESSGEFRRKSRRRDDGESDASGRPPSHRGQKSPRGKEPQVLELRAELENVRASVCDLAREASEERTHHRESSGEFRQKSRRREHDTDGESDASGRSPSHRGQKSPRGKEPQVLELRAELENVRASVCDLAREASEERTRNHEALAHSQQLLSEHERAKTDTAKMVSSAEMLAERRKGLLEVKEVELQRLRAEYHKMENEIQHLMRRNATLEADITRREAGSKQSTDDQERLRKQRAISDADCDAAKVRLSEKEAELSTLRERLSHEQHMHRNECDDFRKVIHDLTLKLEAFGSKARSAEQALAMRSTEEAHTRKDYEARPHTTELQRLGSNLALLTADLKEAHAKLRAADEEADARRAELAAAKKAARSAEAANKNLRAELDRRAADSAAGGHAAPPQQAPEPGGASFNVLVKQVHQLRSELQATAKKHEEADKKLVEARAAAEEAAALRERVARLEAELESAKLALAKETGRQAEARHAEDRFADAARTSRTESDGALREKQRQLEREVSTSRDQSRLLAAKIARLEAENKKQAEQLAVQETAQEDLLHRLKHLMHSGARPEAARQAPVHNEASILVVTPAPSNLQVAPLRSRIVTPPPDTLTPPSTPYGPLGSRMTDKRKKGFLGKGGAFGTRRNPKDKAGGAASGRCRHMTMHRRPFCELVQGEPLKHLDWVAFLERRCVSDAKRQEALDGRATESLKALADRTTKAESVQRAARNDRLRKKADSTRKAELRFEEEMRRARDRDDQFSTGLRDSLSAADSQKKRHLGHLSDEALGRRARTQGLVRKQRQDEFNSSSELTMSLVQKLSCAVPEVASSPTVKALPSLPGICSRTGPSPSHTAHVPSKSPPALGMSAGPQASAPGKGRLTKGAVDAAQEWISFRSKEANRIVNTKETLQQVYARPPANPRPEARPRTEQHRKQVARSQNI
ncbi:hypothetical protein DIPPA_11326 [Diplonema papillatum]|nr:hypothetical protein DIPPA_11326 [Diplonema papillatum]